jgi:hypothetical protein
VVNNENKRVGRPAQIDTLTKIANERQEEQQINSKELMLLAQDGSEKKRKKNNTNKPQRHYNI